MTKKEMQYRIDELEIVVDHYREQEQVSMDVKRELRYEIMELRYEIMELKSKLSLAKSNAVNTCSVLREE